MLNEIVASVERRLPDVVASRAEFEIAANEPRRDFLGALARPAMSVIAEVKRRSPSRGALNLELDPVVQADLYQSGGAAAISVLTERDHFGGTPDDLRRVRRAVHLPILRKDFIIHSAQIWESAAIGADAILLIVAILDDSTLTELLAEATGLNLAVLVEVHTAEELERALKVGARVIGINNRDLRSFEVDLATSELLGGMVGGDRIRVAESGIHSPDDVTRMAAAGFDAILVGESLVRSDDPADLVAQFVAAGI